MFFGFLHFKNKKETILHIRKAIHGGNESTVGGKNTVQGKQGRWEVVIILSGKFLLWHLVTWLSWWHQLYSHRHNSDIVTGYLLAKTIFFYFWKGKFNFFSSSVKHSDPETVPFHQQLIGWDNYHVCEWVSEWWSVWAAPCGIARLIYR